MQHKNKNLKDIKHWKSFFCIFGAYHSLSFYSTVLIIFWYTTYVFNTGTAYIIYILRVPLGHIFN